MSCTDRLQEIQKKFAEENLIGSCIDNNDKCMYAQNLINNYINEMYRHCVCNDIQYDLCVNNYYACIKEVKQDVFPTIKYIKCMWRNNKKCSTTKNENMVIFKKCFDG